MLRSMTGFGSGEARSGGRLVRVEVRSVNHRHLQAKLRLPPEAAHLEADIDALVRRRLTRGAVTLGLQVVREGGAAAARIDEEVLEAYAQRLRALAPRLGLEGGIVLADLLVLPGVLAAEDGEADAGFDKLVLKAVRAALAELCAMREREGAALAADLGKHAAEIDRLVRRIAKRMPSVVRRHQETLRKRVRDLLADEAAISSADLARELALLADRLDVSEELSRLDAHLAALSGLLEKGGTIGRKLDFLAQEFFREANTVGSKCNDAKVTHTVVDLKTSIERLREQVQNIE